MPGDYFIDSQIVKAAKAGDKNALAALYREFNRVMFGICLRMTGNNPDAEDVLQEAFVNAFKNLSKLKQEESFGSWLRQIVINECIRFSKHKIHWEPVDQADLRNETEEEESWFLNFAPADIQKAIKDLPEGYRQVFTLFAIEDFSHKEIAEKLAISISTSKSQYHKAKKMLRERLSKIF